MCLPSISAPPNRRNGRFESMKGAVTSHDSFTSMLPIHKMLDACLKMTYPPSQLDNSWWYTAHLVHASFVHFVSYKLPGREIGIQIKILIGV